MNYDPIMRYCIELALAKTPHGIQKPKVGAVVLGLDGEILSEGYKQFVPGTNMVLHAERDVLDKYRVIDYKHEKTLVTTLEPCVEIHKRQVFSSCSQMILDRGIKRVVIGALDSSMDMTSQAGVRFLRKKGIQVIHLREFEKEIQQSLLCYPKYSSPQV